MSGVFRPLLRIKETENLIMNSYVELVYSNIIGYEAYKKPPKVSWQLSLFTVRLLTDLGFSKTRILEAMDIHKSTVERYRTIKQFNQDQCLEAMRSNILFKELYVRQKEKDEN